MRIPVLKSLFIVAAIAFAVPASAQQYKWIDKNGKVQYGDVPPPGVNATRMRPSSGPATPAPAAAGDGKDSAKDARKGPLTPAEQDAEFRKRQQDAQKARDKDEQAAQAAQAKTENCGNAQAQLGALESGQRIVRTDAKGERVFVDDDQRPAEIAQARKRVAEWCG
jgi:hypothetical protein